MSVHLYPVRSHLIFRATFRSTQVKTSLKILSSNAIHDIPPPKEAAPSQLPVAVHSSNIPTARELSGPRLGSNADKLGTLILLILRGVQKEGRRRKWRIGEVNPPGSDGFALNRGFPGLHAIYPLTLGKIDAEP